MKMHMFVVRDRATETFGNPMFLMSHGQAIRSFSDEVNRKDAQNMLNMHPEDFDLYWLGEYDTDTGSFSPAVRPEKIVEGRAVIIKGTGVPVAQG